jgi:SAM-dependent methyltransferase
MTIKVHLKKVIPKSVLALRWRYLKNKEKKELQRCVDAKGTFTKIYDGGYWGRSAERGDRYYSGYGSHGSEIVDSYVTAVNGFFLSLDKKPNVVDLGCGDFAVGSRIRPYCGKYIAADVVEGLINRNRERYAQDGVEFCVVDILNDDLPKGDVVFLRQVLQHLSNSDIETVVRKLTAKYHSVILTEHLPLSNGFVPNLDMARGPNIRINIGDEGSGVILTEPPFNLLVEQNTVLCEVFLEFGGRKGVVRTNLYRLR